MRRRFMGNSSDFKFREISLRRSPSPFIPLAYHQQSGSREHIGMLEPQITAAGGWPRGICHVTGHDPVFESVSASR